MAQRKPKILAFAGSTRKGSYNKLLAKVAMKGAEQAGAEVTYLDLRELKLPVYDGDLEERDGLPEGATRFKAMLEAHDGLLIASPEYNSSISASHTGSVSRPISAPRGSWAFMCRSTIR